MCEPIPDGRTLAANKEMKSQAKRGHRPVSGQSRPTKARRLRAEQRPTNRGDRRSEPEAAPGRDAELRTSLRSPNHHQPRTVTASDCRRT